MNSMALHHFTMMVWIEGSIMMDLITADRRIIRGGCIKVDCIGADCTRHIVTVVEAGHNE